MAEPAHLVNSAVPKHQQLKGILHDLATRQLAPGDVLPSERQLCTDYGVSRITVREALGQLVTEGVLVRSQGKGTFVAHRPARSQLHLASFTTDMARMGLRPSTVVLDVRLALPPERTAERLRLAPGARAYRLHRLRLADDVPISVDDAWYDAALCPGLDTLDLTRSVYEILATTYGRRIDHAEQTVSAGLAGEAVGGLLQIAADSPVLAFDRLSTSGGTPVEHARSTYRADRYELQMDVGDAVSGSPAP